MHESDRRHFVISAAGPVEALGGIHPSPLAGLLLALCTCLPTTLGGEFKTVADFSTLSPLGGNFSGFSKDTLSPALKNGTVAFIGASPGLRGSHFAAPATGGPIISIVNYGDPMPGEPGPPFPTFFSFGGFSLDGSAITFIGGGPPGSEVGGEWH